jgi:hypothetical protein
MDKAQVEAKLKELRQERQDTSVRAGQLQNQMNELIVRVHQLDGAIAAFESVLGGDQS